MEVRAEKVTEGVGQTDCFEFIAPGMCVGVAATDVFVQGFDTLPRLVSPQTTAEAAVVYVPIPAALARDTASRGYKLTSVKLHYDLDVEGTAASCKLYKITRAADGTIASVAEVTSTCDHTDEQLYAADEHVVTVTPSTAAFVDDGESYYVALSITKKTTTDFSFYGAWAYYTRRL